MVTTAFLGDLGSGKTTLMSRHIIKTKQIHPNKKLHLNYHLYNYEYEDLDLMDLYLNKGEDVKDIIIGADEFYTMMDSRLSGSHRNEVESYFIAMTRKAKADFFLTMQYETFTDCRLSPFIKVKYIMEAIYIQKTIVIDNEQFTYSIPHPYMFKAHLYDDRNSNKPIYKEFLFDGRKWFNEFNTDQYIRPPEDILNRIELRKIKTELQLAKAKIQLEELKNGKSKETKKYKKVKQEISSKLHYI